MAPAPLKHMTRQRKLTRRQIERGVKLRQAGESWYAIARALEVGWWVCRATIDPAYREAERQRLAAAYAEDPDYWRRRDEARRRQRRAQRA